MSDPIPLIDLSIQTGEVRDEIEQLWKGIVDRNQYILGPTVKAFEASIAEYVGAKHAIGLANGTDALLLALRAVGVGPGDEVLLPAFTFVSTAEVIVHLGATPRYTDIDPDTFGMIDAKPTKNTKAIIPVHLFGHPADMDPLRETGLPLIEDAAQSLGAEYKGARTLNLGTINCTSFYPTKNLGAWGDGGMVTTNDDELADKIRLLHNHGWKEKYEPLIVGHNSRLDEMQAAVLITKLKRLDEWNAKRREAAARYDERLKGVVATPVVKDWGTHIYHMYCIRSPKRDEIAAALKNAGIASGIYYPNTLPQTEAFRAEGSYPNSEQATREILAIPIFPGITAAQQERVVDVIRKTTS